jgi:hypothetical protein
MRIVCAGIARPECSHRRLTISDTGTAQRSVASSLYHVYFYQALDSGQSIGEETYIDFPFRSNLAPSDGVE